MHFNVLNNSELCTEVSSLREKNAVQNMLRVNSCQGPGIANSSYLTSYAFSHDLRAGHQAHHLMQSLRKSTIVDTGTYISMIVNALSSKPGHGEVSVFSGSCTSSLGSHCSGHSFLLIEGVETPEKGLGRT